MIRVGDDGTILEVTIVDENKQPKDIAAATIKRIILRPLTCGPGKVLEAAFVTDGQDGKLFIETDADTLDIVGTWEIQGYIESTTWVGHSSTEIFVVYDNL